LVNTREPQSMNAKLVLPIIPIGIVAYAFTLLWDNLCRNSCKQECSWTKYDIFSVNLVIVLFVVTPHSVKHLSHLSLPKKENNKCTSKMKDSITFGSVWLCGVVIG